jgi:hypothetical protein
MALGNETLPLGGDDENNWETRNAATPFIDLSNEDATSQSVANAGQPAFDSTVTPELMAQLGGQQPPPDASAQLASGPPVPDLATPQQQEAPPSIGGNAIAPTPPIVAQPDNAAAPQAPAAAAPPAAALPALGPPPPPPALTGDPTKDVQQNLLYHRQLTDYQALASQHAQALEQHKAQVESKKADRELAIEQGAAAIHNDTIARQNEENARIRKGVDDAVTERAAAYKDLSEGNGFLDAPLGDKILGAIIFAMGDRQATLRNVAAAQLGQASNFQNEGLKTIQGIMERRYQQKLQRLKAASDNVLEARYGFKDAQENHRAALNDLDTDLAANYRLAGKEAEQQLRARGADAATAAGNAVVAGLYEKAADAESKIHEREEELGVKRETAAATALLAKAHLGLAERTAAATEAQRGETNSEARSRIALTRDQMRLAHQDRQDAIDARRGAADEKKAEAKDAKTLRDPDTGEPIAEMPTARAVQTASDKLVASRAYSQGLRELAEDIEKNGHVGSSLPIIGTEAGRKREELHANVVARGRKALDLGVSNANMQLEHQAIGGSGAGLSRMGSPEVLRKIADDNDAFANQRLRSAGKTVPGAVPPAAKTGGAPAGGREVTTSPPAQTVPQPVIDQAWAAVNDPKAPAAVKAKAMRALTAAGQL